MTAIAVERARVDLRPLAWPCSSRRASSYWTSAAGTGTSTTSRVRIATQIAAYVVIGGWLLVAAFRPAWLPRTPLARPIAAAAAVFALTGLLSQRSRLSVESTLAGLAVAALFLLVSAPRIGAVVPDAPARHPRRRTDRRGYRVRGAGRVDVVEWWSLVGAISLPPPLRPGWAGLLFGSPNLIATFLLLSGPLSLAIIWRRHRRVAIGLGALFALAIVLSGSRSALVGLGALLPPSSSSPACAERRPRALPESSLGRGTARGRGRGRDDPPGAGGPVHPGW